MADSVATADDIAALVADTGVSSARAADLLEFATGEIQGVVGQRLVAVEDDQIELFSLTGSVLELPERPVTEVSSITIDGGTALVAGTDYLRPAGSSKLWRTCGWATYSYRPSIVAVTYSHGYAADAQGLVFARSAAFGLAKMAATSLGGIVEESIDDYRVRAGAAVSAAIASKEAENLVAQLRRAYGVRAGVVRVT